MNKNDSLGDRMKKYEDISRIFLTRRIPVIIRIDGKAFHTFTKGFQKPFDEVLINTMQETAKELCERIQGCKIAYVQSDEISLLFTDDDTITTDAWFNKNIQKMVSVSASIATMGFNKSFGLNVWDYQNKGVDEKYSEFINPEIKKFADIYYKKIGTALFDSRAFIIPKEEVANYFIWRQQDATRNSIQMLAQANFSHKQLQGLSCDKLQDKLFIEKGINFNDVETYKKRGSCIIKRNYYKGDTVRSKWIIDKEIPVFTQDKLYIECLL
jgi:tRNA(His) 5'-end guanylyltransferase